MAKTTDLPLKVRLKKFISQYTDSKANAVNLFMYGIIILFIITLVVVLIYSAKLKTAMESIDFGQTTQTQQIDTKK